MATPGFSITLKVGGTSTAVTGEACTNTTGNSYQINTAAKRVWDPAVTPVAYDGGVPAAVDSVDYLFGIVTLSAPPGGAVTVDVNYIPLLDVAQGKGISLKTTTDALDASVFGSQDRVYIAGLRTKTATINTLDTLSTDLDPGAGSWKWATRIDGVAYLVEIDFDGSGANVNRFWSLIVGTDIKAVVDALVTGDIELQSTPVYAADGTLVTFASGAA